MNAPAGAWQFGRFRLEPDRRLLLADGVSITLNSRAYDILELLVRCHDRFVSRDEIVTHVWRGVTVGENNLNVQMSNLRRALGEQADGQKLIVNVPGRGYRLVADVRHTSDPIERIKPLPVEATNRQPASERLEPRRRSATRRLLLPVTLSLVAVLFLLFWVQRSVVVSSAAPMDPRLTILVQRFGTLGGGTRGGELAAQYREVMLARFAEFEDLGLFSETPRLAFVPHFQLTGLVREQGDVTTLTIGLIEEPESQLLYSRDFSLPMHATRTDQSSLAFQMINDVRPILFHAEASRRVGPAKDALDLVIDAHDTIGAGTQVEAYQKAIVLAGRAASAATATRAIRSYFAYLLAGYMLVRGTNHRDEEGGKRALAITDQVLRERPFNLLYLYRRVFILEALGRLDEAEATAEFALRIDPDDSLIKIKYGEIQLMRGNFAVARAMLRADPNDASDDTEATLAFAESQYSACLDLLRPIIAATPDAQFTPFVILLEIATLAQLNRVPEARTLLSSNFAKLPSDLRTISSQRQTQYVLPDDAWQKFKEGLRKAGLAP